MFTSRPQAVEVYERGGWLPASMLGWRHDCDGVCSAWLRVEFAGVVEDAWVELTRLRLAESPARHLALARAPRTSAQAVPAGSADGTGETQQLPLVGQGSTPPVGRRVPPAGGRRRAPETGERPAPAAAAAVVVGASTAQQPGRHRAPAEQGRHRAADTGMLAVVPADGAAPPSDLGDSAPTRAGRDHTSVPPQRSELPPAGPVVRGPAVRDADADAERRTRPLRLDEGVGSARRSRRDTLSV